MAARLHVEGESAAGSSGRVVAVRGVAGVQVALARCEAAAQEFEGLLHE